MFVYFNVWPMATLLVPVWPRDAKKLETHGTHTHTHVCVCILYGQYTCTYVHVCIVCVYRERERDYTPMFELLVAP